MTLTRFALVGLALFVCGIGLAGCEGDDSLWQSFSVGYDAGTRTLRARGEFFIGGPANPDGSIPAPLLITFDGDKPHSTFWGNNYEWKYEGVDFVADHVFSLADSTGKVFKFEPHIDPLHIVSAPAELSRSKTYTMTVRNGEAGEGTIDDSMGIIMTQIQDTGEEYTTQFNVEIGSNNQVLFDTRPRQIPGNHFYIPLEDFKNGSATLSLMRVRQKSNHTLAYKMTSYKTPPITIQITD